MKRTGGPLSLTLALALPLLAVGAATAQPLRIAAASDLQPVLPLIAAQFERDTGHEAVLTFGSSGNFFTQIQNGAPFDVFMSADVEYPRRLERDGLAERGRLYEYAAGRIVLWSRADSGVDLKKGLRTGLSALTDPGLRRVAIANPEHAPYGRAAVAALRHEGIYDSVRSKLVMGENVSQAAQFAQSGNADVGIIALSLALTAALKSAGAYVEIPAAWHEPIAQAAVVVSASPQKALARRFIDALKTPDSLRILQSYGFAVAAATAR
jgi:molybdate transport system substrate-binding protein